MTQFDAVNSLETIVVRGGPNADSFLIRKSTDETKTTDDVLANDSELLFTVGSGESWYFKSVLIVEVGNPTPDITVSVDAPSGTLICSAFNLEDGDSTIFANITDEVDFPMVASEMRAVTIDGTFKSTASGVVAVQWSQMTSSAQFTRVKEGSLLFANKLL